MRQWYLRVVRQANSKLPRGFPNKCVILLSSYYITHPHANYPDGEITAIYRICFVCFGTGPFRCKMVSKFENWPRKNGKYFITFHKYFKSFLGSLFWIWNGKYWRYFQINTNYNFWRNIMILVCCILIVDLFRAIERFHHLLFRKF